MIDHPEFDNPNLRILARKIKNIDTSKVLMVRFWPIVDKEKLNEFGQNTYLFSVVLEKDINDTNNYLQKIIHLYVPKIHWDSLDDSGHNVVVDEFTKNIKYYYDNTTAYNSTQT